MLTVYIKLTNRKSYFIFSGVFLFGLFLIVDLQRMTEGYYWNVSQLTFHQKHTFTSLIIWILFAVHIWIILFAIHIYLIICVAVHIRQRRIYTRLSLHPHRYHGLHHPTTTCLIYLLLYVWFMLIFVNSMTE